MKRLLLAATILAAAGTAPAYADLMMSFGVQGGQTFTCADGQLCDDAGAANDLLTINQNLSGVQFNGTFSSSSPDTLSMSNLTITNDTGAAVTITGAFSQTGFAGPVADMSMSGSGTFVHNVGGSGELSFHADPANTQGATSPTDAPGQLLFAPSLTMITTDPQAFDGNNNVPFAANGPFSMALDYTITLQSGASVTGLESAETATPVPGPVIGAGLPAFVLAGAAFAFLRRRHLGGIMGKVLLGAGLAVASTAVARADVMVEDKLSGTGDNVVFDSFNGTNLAIGSFNGQHTGLVNFTDLSNNPGFTGSSSGNDIKIANTSDLQIVVFDSTDTIVQDTSEQVFSLKGAGDVTATVQATDGTFTFDLGAINPNAQSGFTLLATNGESMSELTLTDAGGTISDFEHYRIDVVPGPTIGAGVPGMILGVLGMIWFNRTRRTRFTI